VDVSAGPEAIARCLVAIRDGEASVGDLIPLVYRQLRTMARAQLQKRPDRLDRPGWAYLINKIYGE
jgi:hypothetical protein